MIVTIVAVLIGLRCSIGGCLRRVVSGSCCLMVLSFAMIGSANAQISVQTYFSGCVWPNDSCVEGFKSAAAGGSILSNSPQISSSTGYYEVWGQYCPSYAPHYNASAPVGCYSSCPAGTEEVAITYEWSSGGQVGSSPATRCMVPCPEGEVRNSTTGVCEPPPCQSGAALSDRFLVGYHAKENWDGVQAPTWPEPLPTTACAGNGSGGLCAMTVSGFAPGSGYMSPNGPPYAITYVLTGEASGESCSGQTEPSPTDPDPVPCPSGHVAGSVNGVDGCYRSQTETSTTNTTANPDGTSTTTTTTTKPDGSTVTTVTDKDATGETTGTTTTTTPASTGTGNGGAGDPSGLDPESESICAKMPNAALCKEKVPIDETGTPTTVVGTGPGEGVTDRLNGIADELEGKINGTSWRKTELGFVWNPQVPSGACAAVEIYAISIDICEPLGKARDFWSWSLGMLAALAIWIRSTRALAGV